jgi:hypothetical protein
MCAGGDVHHVVVLHLSDDEYQWYCAVAARDGMSVEEWIGVMVREQARDVGGFTDPSDVPTRPDWKRG